MSGHLDWGASVFYDGDYRRQREAVWLETDPACEKTARVPVYIRMRSLENAPNPSSLQQLTQTRPAHRQERVCIIEEDIDLCTVKNIISAIPSTQIAQYAYDACPLTIRISCK